MTAINADAFADPVSRRLAAGEQVGSATIWLDPRGDEQLTVINGGVIDPQPHPLAAGTRLYRFGSHARGVEHVLRGGWWLERAQLDHLINWARQHDRTLGYAARQLCCLPPEWGNDLNFLIAVETRGLIMAWRGLAASAVGVDRSTRLPGFARQPTVTTARNDIAALRVPQLFIPGTRERADAMFAFDGQWQTEGARDWVAGSGY